MGVFERFLSLWVALAMLAGVALGLLAPQQVQALAGFEFAQVNGIVALLIWAMVYPMMIQIDWGAVREVGRKPQGLALTLVVNWLIKPFTMAALGVLFFRYLFAPWVDPSAQQYIAGMILLGVAPCTAMVFVWSQLVKGDGLHAGAGVGERPDHGLRLRADRRLPAGRHRPERALGHAAAVDPALRGAAADGRHGDAPPAAAARRRGGVQRFVAALKPGRCWA
jgi:hypothetical protein